MTESICTPLNIAPNVLVFAWFITSVLFVIIPKQMYLATSLFSMYSLIHYSEFMTEKMHDLPSFYIFVTIITVLFWCVVRAFSIALN